MANYIFQKISREGIKAGQTPGTPDSRRWFRDRAAQATRINLSDISSTRAAKASMQRSVRGGDIGRLLMFQYDPKHKVTLPYYDKFPVIFPIEKHSNGFTGINFHYLPLMFRARLMDALYSLEEDDSIKESKKLAISYNILKGAARFKYFKPCIKRYLNSHVVSRFIYIPYDQWDIALFLPLERFAKKNKNFVWQESIRRSR